MWHCLALVRELRNMRATLAAVLSLFLAQAADATTYYVSQSGSDSNNGISSSTPFAHIKTGLSAAAAGDTVCIIDSATYTYAYENNGSRGAVIDVEKSGISGHPITIMACNGAHPVINHGSAVFRSVWVHNQSYITIGPGLDIYGESDRKTLHYCTTSPGKRDNACIGVGIACSGHHLVFTGNIVHDNGLGGITCSPSAFGASPLAVLDFVTISNNVVYRNAFYHPSGGSGISLYELTNVDTAAGYHIFITGNYSWGNRMYVKETGFKAPIDGNGCIIDDGAHTQHSNQGAAYSSSTLVENNIFVGNGGTGCHDNHTGNVDFLFNDFYANVQSYPELKAAGDKMLNRGETGAFAGPGGNTRWYNNIIVSNNQGSDIPLIFRCSTTACSADYNLQFSLGNNPTLIHGAHDPSGPPQIVSPNVCGVPDWHLMPTSPAAGKADPAFTASTDFYGATRPSTASIGAAEVETLGSHLRLPEWMLKRIRCH
jgi:hypothetical protein